MSLPRLCLATILLAATPFPPLRAQRTGGDTTSEPKDVAAFCQRADGLYCKGQYDKAIADYDQAIRLDPKSGPAYAGRGFAWCGKGDWAKAIKDFDEAEHLGHRPSLDFHGGDFSPLNACKFSKTGCFSPSSLTVAMT